MRSSRLDLCCSSLEGGILIPFLYFIKLEFNTLGTGKKIGWATHACVLVDRASSA